MDVALASQLLIGGVKVSRFEEAGRDYDILVRADEGARTSPEALSQLTVASTKLGTVPLLDVIDLKKGEGPSKIERFARQRRVMFLANTAPGVGSGEVGAALETAVKEMKLPAEYTFGAFGQSKEIKRTGLAFMFAFGLSFLFMYLILAAQFESWLHPITILLSLPLTVPFALVSLIFLKSSLDIFTMLGILVLFGVVKKNSILQIAHIIQLRAEGHSRYDAILHGNRDRLRPILMTTFAFVAGMLPLVTSHGIGAEFNRATAGPVVIGQLLSLLLTLLATPVAYTFFDDASNGLRRLFRIRKRPDSETGADEIMGPAPGCPRGQRAPCSCSCARRGCILNRGTSAASLAVVLALAIVTAPARAATVAAERELTLDDALALAKKRNKSLVAERAKVAQAQTNLSSAWARLLPTIAAQGKYTRNTPSSISARHGRTR